MNKNLSIALGIIVLALVGIGAVWAYNAQQKTSVTQPIATTTDTTVTETPAPATTTPPAPAPEKQADTAALNQRIYDNGVHITPLEVVEDSRCPMGVYCIQAGTVRLKAKLEDGTRSEVITMVMGSPVAFGNKHVTLMSVTPVKAQHSTIAPSDYRFTFSVTYGMGGDAP